MFTMESQVTLDTKENEVLLSCAWAPYYSLVLFIGCLVQQCLLVLLYGPALAKRRCSAENRFVPHHAFRSLFVLLCEAPSV